MKSKYIYIIVGVLAFLFILGLIPDDSKPAQPAKVEKTAEQIKAEAEQKKAEELKRKNEEIIKKANIDLGYEKPPPPPITVEKKTLLVACQMKVKENLKDPKSFEMEKRDFKREYRYIENYEDLRISFNFSAKNSFNANTRQNALCVFSRDGKWLDFEIR